MLFTSVSKAYLTLGQRPITIDPQVILVYITMPYLICAEFNNFKPLRET